MRPFDNFTDLTGKNRNLKCSYHGKDQFLHLEGKIMSETSSELVIGVSLREFEIESHNYDPARKSFDIRYKPHKKLVSDMLYIEKFIVPKDIKEINVYDKGQKVK